MKKKILVADDDPINLEVVLELLDANDYEVLYATNGQVACEIAENELPDLIIMDWQMPIMNGIEAINTITNNPKTLEIPIIVATGVMTGAENLSAALEKGAVDFVSKPFNAIEFKARVKACLRLKEQNDTIKKYLEKEKEFIQETLELKERELNSIAIFDFEKSQLLKKLAEDIQRIENKAGEGDILKDLKELKRKAKSQINFEKSWDNFKKHFEQVHSAFFERLLRTHPTVNPNDLRMCAYIKIGLDNTEMSRLLNIEQASVRKSLHRLKQKLGLTTDDVLREYINTI